MPRLLVVDGVSLDLIIRDTLRAVILAFFLGAVSSPLMAQERDSRAGTTAGTAGDNAVDAASSNKQKRPTRWGEPTRIEILVYVIDVDEVNSANQNFSASVYYEAHWNNPFLRHEGPGPLVRRTTDVWTPSLVLVNQQQSWSAFPSFVEIWPNGDVVLKQKTWGWFSQPMDLRNFPFDQQTLTIHLVTAGLLESEVELVSMKMAEQRQSGIHKGFSLPDFSVVSWKAEPRPYIAFEGQKGTAGYIMEIKIKRKSSYYVWKMIFPLCLIVIMSWAPRWLDPKEISTSIAISTTAFLTLVAYLFAITVLLPRVSYLTRMDQFILFSMALVFAGLLQTVISTYQLALGKINQIQYQDKFSRAIYPLLLVIVLVLSFA